MARDDAEIISKILASGNPDGFLLLFRHYSIAVEEVISRVWELELSEQKAAVEEAFFQVFSSLEKIREPSRFPEYLFGTAYSTALKRRSAFSPSNGSIFPAEFGRDAFVDVSTIRIPCPLSEIAQCIRQAAETLPDSDRALAMDCFFGQRIRPQILADLRKVELAAVGRAISGALLRAKMFVIARIAEGNVSRFSASPASFLEPAAASESVRQPRAADGVQLHLTDEIYTAVLNGERPVGFDREFAAHLKSGCQVCEEQIRRRSEIADVLDAVIWAALFADAPARVRGNIPMFRRIVRRLRLDARFSGRKEAGAFHSAWFRDDRLPLTLAAILGILGLLMFSISTLPEARQENFWEKSSASSPPEINIAAIFPSTEEAQTPAEKKKTETDGRSQKSDGDESEEEDDLIGQKLWLNPGQQLTSAAQIAVNYSITRSRFVAVLRFHPNGDPELLDMPGRLPPGTHSLSINGVPSRMILRDAEGINRFIVVTADRPLDAQILGEALLQIQDLEEPAGTLTPKNEKLNGVDVSWFDLDVEPPPQKNEEISAEAR